LPIRVRVRLVRIRVRVRVPSDGDVSALRVTEERFLRGLELWLSREEDPASIEKAREREDSDANDREQQRPGGNQLVAHQGPTKVFGEAVEVELGQRSAVAQREEGAERDASLREVVQVTDKLHPRVVGDLIVVLDVLHGGLDAGDDIVRDVGVRVQDVVVVVPEHVVEEVIGHGGRKGIAVRGEFRVDLVREVLQVGKELGDRLKQADGVEGGVALDPEVEAIAGHPEQLLLRSVVFKSVVNRLKERKLAAVVVHKGVFDLVAGSV